MNKGKWSGPHVPVMALALKLSEEAAEVGTEINDDFMGARKLNLARVMEELDHVDFISATLRARLTDERSGRYVPSIR